jgi:hypothetical protein
MSSLFIAQETLPFTVAICVMLGLAVIEGIGLFTAISPSEWLDGLIPNIDAPEGLQGALGWLHLGKVPMLVLLILFLFGFAICGYVLQLLARNILGGYLPGLLASVPATFAGLATVRGMGAVLVHIIPRDESSAVSEQELLGLTGVITQGTARCGHPAEAKVRDANGRYHYLRLVLVVRKLGAVYRGIHNPHPEILS